MHRFGEGREAVEQRVGIAGGEYLLERFSLLELQLVVAAADSEPEEMLDEVGLGLEYSANGRLGNAGRAGDVGESRRAVPLLAERRASGLEDPLTGLSRLLLAQR